ncbi:transcriptional adapter 2B-like isoform X1 [Diabrotica virgifera virgifera]|uniref:Transcriptional adapter n=1 Tax=Diabrotica virgifera virgifera TaxID=50390 RepID=A0ABM5KHH7_DIAVI|nr:transcriptional adapter 2B-like isoform X1 [Diabrotica virgifera virgifera]
MSDLFTKVSCTYCQEEINNVRVRCCICPDFDICLQCFSIGAEIGPHKSDHAYQLMDPCSTSIFGGRGAWTGGEHLLLLDAVELYGFGNWELISEHVETRSAEEVKEEYIARYVDGNLGKVTMTNPNLKKPVLVDHTIDDDASVTPAPPLDVTLEEANLLGYKPYRDDYEMEYNMEAEGLVSKLSLDPEEDSGVEIVLKLMIVDMYMRRLKERTRRKKIVKDYQLVAKYFENLRMDPYKAQITRDQRELKDKFRVFSQFMRPADYERITSSLEKEKDLRHRLSELTRYRSLGLRTQEEINQYEQHVVQRQNSEPGTSSMVQLEFHQNGNSDEQDIPMDIISGETETNGCSSSSNVDLSPVDASTLRYHPMGNLLSENEINLCANLNIRPGHYTTLKLMIIQDNLVSPGKYRNLPAEGEEGSVKEAITQYLSTSGWLPNMSF